MPKVSILRFIVCAATLIRDPYPYTGSPIISAADEFILSRFFPPADTAVDPSIIVTFLRYIYTYRLLMRAEYFLVT